MKLDFFHNITDNQFIETQLEVVQLEKSEKLFEENKPLEYIYFILKGELAINKGKHFLWTALNNEFIGISSFFSKEPNYAYTVEALKKTQVLKMSKQDFKEAINHSRKLNNSIIDVLCKRIKLTLAKGKGFF